MINKELFELFCDIANKRYDGHFTLMKFTTNWRCGFGTVHAGYVNQRGIPVSEVSGMAIGKDANEAISNCIVQEINRI